MSLDRAVGIMCPDIWGTYFCEVLGGVQAAAVRSGYRVIAIKSSPRRVHELGLARDQIDGWIALIDAEDIERFLDDGRPVVTLSTRARNARCPHVVPDNHGGALAAVRHLIEHGHTRIAFGGYMAHDDVKQRFQAYRDALGEGGVPLDPALVIEIPSNERASGRLAVQRLFEAGMPCTALFMATDQGALGALDALTEAGVRVPEDLALVGFDDIEAARYASPPLTTVRQRFDAVSGTAAQLLIDLLAGRDVANAGHVAPTTLVVRRSCGCSPAPAQAEPAPPGGAAGEAGGAAGEAGGAAGEAGGAAGEAGALARDLVALAGSSTAPDEDPWPWVTDVVAGLEAAAQGRPGPPAAALERAWREAVEQVPDVDLLLAMIDRLERAGQAMLRGAGGGAAANASAAAAGHASAAAAAHACDAAAHACDAAGHACDAAAGERIAAYVREARREMVRSRVAVETARADFLNGLLDINLVIRETLLEDAGGGGSKLSWLSAVQMSWGCLAVWDAPGDAGPTLRIVESACRGAETAAPAAGTRVAAAEFPRGDWLPAAVQRDGDHVIRLIPLRSEDQERGVLAVCAPVSSPLGLDHRDMAVWVAMLTASLEREALIESLVEQERQTHAAYERERALADAVRRLGCPVIPLDGGVLLVPLVGAIDLERARQVLEVVLTEISRQEAEVLLLDITGVPFADQQVAESLMKTARAAVLLGAEVIVVGVRPQVAKGFTQLGVELQGLTLHATLGRALSALRHRRATAARAPNALIDPK
ncbi:substrate-binding domain-containing protein [Sorangium sp. So ce1024]|uniref:substrate-binding domain-containing protein n=1 Tax=unclassified Sorangium TaxID=2621164 RepID=UPI003F09933F